MWLSRRIIAAIAALALFPLFVTMLTAMLAVALRCEVSDIGPTQCLIFGSDIGGVLSAAMNFGWVSLVTIPLLMAVVTLWTLVEAFVWHRRRRRSRHAAASHGGA